MKLRFDTYTLSLDTALNAFAGLSGVTDNLTLTVNEWNVRCFNLHGEVNSEDVAELHKLCGGEDWNEDYSEL